MNKLVLKSKGSANYFSLSLFYLFYYFILFFCKMHLMLRNNSLITFFKKVKIWAEKKQKHYNIYDSLKLWSIYRILEDFSEIKDNLSDLL